MDSGLTLSHLLKLLSSRSPASLKICCLLDKPSRRECDLTPDYRGFEIPNEFVVGYGLDYNGFLRNLPYVGVLKPSVYSGEEGITSLNGVIRKKRIGSRARRRKNAWRMVRGRCFQNGITRRWRKVS